MSSNRDSWVMSFCAALVLLAVVAHIWAIYYRYRLCIRHLGDPALLKKDLIEFSSIALTGIGLAIMLGVYIALLVR